MLTLMPARLTVWVTRTAAAISVPATNRPEIRRPIADRSAKLRRERFSERWTKNALSMQNLPGRGSSEKDCRPLVGRSQKVVSQTPHVAGRTEITLGLYWVFVRRDLNLTLGDS